MKDLAQIDGDSMLLGIGEKIGPSLARLAKNAIKKATMYSLSAHPWRGNVEELLMEIIMKINLWETWINYN
jgi:hypothetical protein